LLCDIKAVNAITDKEYYVRGQTALLDAGGKSEPAPGIYRKKAARVKGRLLLFFVCAHRKRF
jgi:hypothetical protein